MPRVERIDVGEYVYHILNRANAQVQIFDSDKDYQLFENIFEEEAIKRSIIKGNPYGGDSWVDSVVKRFSLEQTLRKVGRPKTKNGG